MAGGTEGERLGDEPAAEASSGAIPLTGFFSAERVTPDRRGPPPFGLAEKDVRVASDGARDEPAGGVARIVTVFFIIPAVAPVG